MDEFLFSRRDISWEPAGTRPPTLVTVRAVGTQRTQRSWSWMVLEGFLEKIVEDGGLGTGVLG